jgi:hypothetical protein
MNHVKKSSDYFLRFDQILAIENFKKHLILALINFYIAIFATVLVHSGLKSGTVR